MATRTLTFVYGRTYMHAAEWIRKHVASGRLQNEDCRNITNPESLRGLKSTDNTDIHFIWLHGCRWNSKFRQFENMMQQRQVSNANIKEFESA